MQEFKKVSYLAVSIWLSSILIANWFHFNSEIKKDPTFINQLLHLERDYSSKNKILVYGSSGLLMGISSELIEKNIGINSFNLSSSGLGGQIEMAIKSIAPKSYPADVILIGDRDYRNPTSENTIFKKISNSIKIIPNLRPSFFPVASNRSLRGDLEIYPESFFIAKSHNPLPIYNEKLIIKKMQTQIKLAKQLDLCPVLIFVPILVNPNEKAQFELATKNLISHAESEGLSQNILNLLSVETDKNLFSDQFHLSKNGREKWTKAVTNELLERNLCGVKQLNL